VGITYKVFPTATDLAESIASQLTERIRSANNTYSTLTIALSGGNTPKLLFSVLAEKHNDMINWNYVHLFWVDERCVPASDPESNYGMTAGILLEKAGIPAENIHRMRGEDEPKTEAIRYSDEIRQNTYMRDGLPVFDIIILGMGDDGHTASIFPGNLELINSSQICEMAVHPVTGQKRVTLTGKVINNAKEIIFLVTGSNKASVVAEVIGKETINLNYPAAHINSKHGETTWLLDREAAKLIK
jgi:6-phosphogluconolactonase